MNTRQLLSLTAGLAFCTLFAACQTGPFSGSGSMRIEVEVYKGPLSQEPELQWGELVGYLEEAKRSMVENANFTLAVVANKDFETMNSSLLRPIDVNALWPEVRASSPLLRTSSSLEASGAASEPLVSMYLYEPMIAKKKRGFWNNLFGSSAVQADDDDSRSKTTKAPTASDNAVNKTTGNPTKPGSDTISNERPAPNLTTASGNSSGKGAAEVTPAFAVSDGNDSGRSQTTGEDSFKLNWCNGLDPSGLWDQLDYFDCVALRGIYTDSLDLIREVNEFLKKYGTRIHEQPKLEPAEASRILAEVAEMSSELRAKAFRWAVSTTAGQSFDLSVRMAVLNFVVLASEYGNQLQARADALLKQRDGGYVDRRELSLSTFIRDSQPTDFVRLYDWLGGSTDALRYKVPDFLMTGHWPASVGDRTKAVDRLFADHYWSKINTVYASGKGKVSMAFVKDDIGNWDLKNMDNAPGELLSAYTTFATSIAKQGTDIATAYFTGGTSEALKTAKEFINAARVAESQIIGSQSVGLQAGQRLQELQRDAAAEIQNTWQSRQAEDVSLYEESKDPIDKAAAQRLSAHRKETYAQLARVVQHYKDNVDITRKATERLANKGTVGVTAPDLPAALTSGKTK